MKILHLNCTSSLVGNFLEASIRSAFLKAGISYSYLDLIGRVTEYINQLKAAAKFAEKEAVTMADEFASSLILHSAQRLKADFIFFQNGGDLYGILVKIINNIPGKLVCWQTDDPYDIDVSVNYSALCEYIFTVDSSTLSEYKKNGCKNAYYLPNAFPKGLMVKVGKKEAAGKYYSDICFIGTPFERSKRVEVIDKMSAFFKDYRVRIMGSHLVGYSWREALKNYKIIKRAIYEDFIPQAEAAKYMLSSKINLNIHRDSYGDQIGNNQRGIMANSPNDRTFILAGIGAFQLVDDSRKDLRNLFKPGEEVVTFSSKGDLKEKIEYYLAHEKERQKIARAARERVIREHTYHHRIRQMLSIISKK